MSADRIDQNRGLPTREAVFEFMLDEPVSNRRPWQTHYNGWSWEERCAITPIQNEAIRTGKLVRPTVCSICNFSDPANPKGRGYIFLHTERYDRPLEVLGCCKRCHAALHARFRDPERFRSVVARNYRQGAWFMLLSFDPASQFRPFDETYPDGI